MCMLTVLTIQFSLLLSVTGTCARKSTTTECPRSCPRRLKLPHGPSSYRGKRKPPGLIHYQSLFRLQTLIDGCAAFYEPPSTRTFRSTYYITQHRHSHAP